MAHSERFSLLPNLTSPQHSSKSFCNCVYYPESFPASTLFTASATSVKKKKSITHKRIKLSKSLPKCGSQGPLRVTLHKGHCGIGSNSKLSFNSLRINNQVHSGENRVLCSCRSNNVLSGRQLKYIYKFSAWFQRQRNLLNMELILFSDMNCIIQLSGA